ncbi:MAG: hypothetical protein Mars2KO_24600 [Maribacter sp.]
MRFSYGGGSWLKSTFDRNANFLLPNMPSKHENFRNNPSVRLNRSNRIEGLCSFKKDLEKYFFSQVAIHECIEDSESAKLVLEISCNFGITEMLHHLNIGTWGNFNSPDLNFSELLETLKESNDFDIEIEELSFFMKDTSIIINKIYDESIPEQLEAILQSLSENFVHFTKGVTEIPYEIYVPIFEESLIENDMTLMKNIIYGNHDIQDYFKYWGLYFYSDDGALIYDLKNTAIISGDLHMLNW